MYFRRFFTPLQLVLLCQLMYAVKSDPLFSRLFPNFSHVFKEVENRPVLFTSPRPTPTTTVPTKIVTPEETIFNLGPRLQQYEDSSAGNNYIMSPLSAAVILGQVLVGTHHWQHNLIAQLLDLETKKIKRQITVIQESNDSLYDSNLYHGAFYFKLMVLVRNILSDRDKDLVALDYALFYDKEVTLVNEFIKNMNKAYRPTLEMIPVEFSSITTSIDVINSWASIKSNIFLRDSLKMLIKPQTQSILLHSLVIDCMWKFEMTRTLDAEDFYRSPSDIVKVKYLKGVIPSTTYVKDDGFSLVSIPLNHEDTYVYVLLPSQPDQIQRFSENLNVNYFQTALKQQRIATVKMKVPDVFSQQLEFDIMRPVLKYINDFNERKGKNDATYVKLNRAAKNLELNNLLQYVRLSITGEKNEEIPEERDGDRYEDYTSDKHEDSSMNFLNPSKVRTVLPQSKFITSHGEKMSKIIPTVTPLRRNPSSHINQYTDWKKSYFSHPPFNSVYNKDNNLPPDYVVPHTLPREPNDNPLNISEVSNEYNPVYLNQNFDSSRGVSQIFNPQHAVLPHDNGAYLDGYQPKSYDYHYYRFPHQDSTEYELIHDSVNSNPQINGQLNQPQHFSYYNIIPQDMFRMLNSEQDVATPKNNYPTKSGFNFFQHGHGKTKREVLPEEIYFEVTRPFVFIIMNERSNMVLLWGCITDPEKNNT